ncbi:MAG: glycerate kinase [Thermoguttaceae bacterium]|nr:glycerate kinase [Thermoguttaceae bacterium]
MKLLFASDSFKGTLSSAETSTLLTRAAREVFGDVECDSVVVSDGGEGALDAVVSATGGEKLTVDAHGPLMEPRRASYGAFGDNRAIVEMATVSGLTLVPVEQRNPLNTTTFGVGELILDALARGYRDISLAIGGSATNDGGMGCARALGARFLDRHGRELEGYGRDLERVAEIDASGLDPRLAEARVTVMSDVSAPLCGANGATRVFGPQKGATPEIVERLEEGMLNYRDVVRRQFGIDPDALRGGGAAGGLGTALAVFLHGEMRSGIDVVLDLIDFDARLKDVDLVVTGEGQTDWQSCFGKVMQGVGLRAKRAGVMAIGLSGSLGRDATKLFDYGIESLATTVDAPMTLETALSRAEELYYLGAIRMFRLVRVGMKIAQS